MEVDMEGVLESYDAENMRLNVSLTDLETENHHLQEKVTLLEKALDREKKFHRKYADEVGATEAIRIEDFRKEKRSLIEENKALTVKNRQLVKDVAFYKSAHEELAVEGPSKSTSAINSFQERSVNIGAYELRSTSKSETQTSNSCKLSSSVQKNSKAAIKANLIMFENNKKLKAKIVDIRATVAHLKKKNKQLENFRQKIENKKSKYGQDSLELEELVTSSQKKNEDTYTPDVLAMLRQLANNKK